MYPRYAPEFEGGDSFVCSIISAPSLKGLIIRSATQMIAYRDMHACLRASFWGDAPWYAPLPLAELTHGRSCVVRLSHGLYRGEVVQVDDEGYAEVFLVDYGETQFFWASALIEVPALLSLVPSLYVECGLYGMDEIADYAHAIGVINATMPDSFWGNIVVYGGAGTPPQILLRDVDLEDLGGFLAEYFAEENIAYEALFVDEGFVDGPAAA